MSLLDTPVGFAGERKALAISCLAFYAAFYGLVSFIFYMAPPDQPEMRAWVPAFLALCATYGVAFFALAADWFWARWFAVGLGYSGVTVAVWGMVSQQSIDQVLLFYGVTHGLITVSLQGQKLTHHFDGQPSWRQWLRISDEQSVEKIRHTVTRAAASLPTLILFALSPREAKGALLLLVGLGLFGVLRNRTAGVLLLLGASVCIPFALLHMHEPETLQTGSLLAAWTTPVRLHGFAGFSGLLLLWATWPFLQPMLRHVRR